jgi:hypothetical protein
MLNRAVVIWIIGLLTLVPYGTYYLLFEASRDQYAILIIGILFWIFGYWSLAGILLMAVKTRAMFRALERAQSQEALRKTLHSKEAREVAVELIAAENGIPRFIAARVYHLLVARLSASNGAPDNNR